MSALLTPVASQQFPLEQILLKQIMQFDIQKIKLN